ncbi:MAG TPA: GMC oxidoreductase [Microlunatus sp.]
MEDQRETVDVLIVGSGPAGATYARTIGDAAPRATVLMVEVGPIVPGSRGDHTQNMTDEERAAAQLLTQGPDSGVVRAAALSDIAPGIDPSLEFRQTILPGLHFVDPRPALEPGEVGLPAASMASGVGGMGIHWGTSSPRPQQSERIPFIDADDLDTALARAEELLSTTAFAVPGRGLPEALRAAVAEALDGPGLNPTGFMPTSTRWENGSLRFAGTGAILGELESRMAGFELRAETLAERVLVEDGVAVGAALRDRRSDTTYEVRAQHVVVCADGLRTPQVLFASGIRPSALGHYLNEHFQMATFLTLDDEFDPQRFDHDPENVVSIVTPFSDARPLQMGVIALASSAFKINLGDGASLGGDRSMSRLAITACYAAKDIQFTDAVEFSDSEVDFYGMPRMRISYSHTDADRAVIDQMREVSVAVAGRLGTPMDPPELAAGGSSLHYQGTVRMGATDDGTSVCSPDLEVWGVENLYLGGNGVIPTATASNPTLTTVALAWRAATRLAERLTEKPVETSGVTA